MKIKNIKFKAKQLNSGKWFEGDLVRLGNRVCIGGDHIKDGITDVDPSTVCMFTGLKDENGKEVWEHDILESPFLKGEVIFFNGCFRVKKDDGSSLSFPTLSIINGKLRYFSVVGNKFDRKEDEYGKTNNN